MAADIKEKKFIETVLNRATQIIANQEDLTNAVDIYSDRSYAANLEEDDLTAYGLTKEQFIAIASFTAAFDLFLDGAGHDVADYRKVLNILRTDK